MKQVLKTWLDLISMGNTAVIRDKQGDVFERRGGLWCGYECKPLTDAEMEKYLPATVLDNGHFPGRLAAGAAAIAQTSAGADGSMDPERIAEIVLAAADAWEGEEFGGMPTITLYHNAEDSEDSLHSYIHDALLDLADPHGETIMATLDDIMAKVWDTIEERTATE